MNMTKQLLALAATAIIMKSAEAAAQNEACADSDYQCKLYTGSDDTGDYWHYCLRTNWWGDRLPHEGYSFVDHDPNNQYEDELNNQFQNEQIGYVSCGANVTIELCAGEFISEYNSET